MFKNKIGSPLRKPADPRCSWLPRPILSWEWTSMMSAPALVQNSWLWQGHQWAKGPPNVCINGSWYQTLFCTIMVWKPGTLSKDSAFFWILMFSWTAKMWYSSTFPGQSCDRKDKWPTLHFILKQGSHYITFLIAVWVFWAPLAQLD